MKAVIICGGFGTRLIPMTNKLPKPLLNIANIPTLDYNLMLLSYYGFKEVTLIIHYLGDMIKNYLGNFKYNIHINYYVEDKPLGTAGAISNIIQDQSSNNDDILLLSGDILTNIQLDKFIKYHYKLDGIVTIACIKMHNASQYGIIEIDKNNQINTFIEKPQTSIDSPNSYHLVNTGIYCFKQSLIKYMNKIPIDFACDIFNNILISKNDKMYCYTMTENWIDIGTYKTYKQANIDILNNKIKFPFNQKEKFKNGINKDYIGKNCTINNNVQIKDNSIIGNNVTINSNSVIESDTFIKDNSIINEPFPS